MLQRLSNYGPRVIDRSGLKHVPYMFIAGQGFRYANGQTFVGNSIAIQPATLVAPALATPSGCRDC